MINCDINCKFNNSIYIISILNTKEGRMQIILSPAKKLCLESKYDGKFTNPEFIFEASQIMSELRKETVKSISEKMKVSKDIAEENYNRYKEWREEVADDYICAGFLYDGATFQGLDFNSFNVADIHYSQSHLTILSALYGVLRPLDAIMPYRLEMNQKNIVVDGKKNFYEFWKLKITNLLNFNLNEDKILINLASDEYSKVIDKKIFKGNIITPIFKDNKNGVYKIISSYVKRARGSMARFIITNRISDIEELKRFDYDGYKFDAFEGDSMIFKRDVRN